MSKKGEAKKWKNCENSHRMKSLDEPTSEHEGQSRTLWEIVPVTLLVEPATYKCTVIHQLSFHKEVKTLSLYTLLFQSPPTYNMHFKKITYHALM